MQGAKSQTRIGTWLVSLNGHYTIFPEGEGGGGVTDDTSMVPIPISGPQIQGQKTSNICILGRGWPKKLHHYRIMDPK